MRQLDYKSCLEIIKRANPNLGTPPVLFDNGSDYIAILVEKTVYRFAKTPEVAHNQRPVTAFLNRFCKTSPVAVPMPALRIDEETGTVFETYPFIEGVPLTVDLGKTLSENELTSVAEKLGAFLSALHSFPAQEAEKLGLERANPLLIRRQRLEKIQRLVFPLLEEKNRKWIKELCENFFQTLENHPFALRTIHSNLKLRHILFDTNKRAVTGVIDFGDAKICDPAHDFQYANFYGKKFLDTVYSNYSIPLDETFEARRKFYEYRVPISRLRSAVERKDKGLTEQRKKILTDFINNHPI